MSTLLLATSCALLLGQVDSGRSGQLNRSDVDEGKTCVCIKKLELPGYPPLALFARLTGTATADVSLGPSGAIGQIVVSGMTRLGWIMRRIVIRPIRWAGS